MKQLKQQTEKTKKKIAFNLNPLGQKVMAAKKSAEKASADYDAKMAEYETAAENKADKISLARLAAGVKIARYKYKIKRAESKLAKLELKMTRKKEKKEKESIQEPAMA